MIDESEVDHYVASYFEKKLNPSALSIKYALFNLNIEDELNKKHLPENIKKTIYTITKYIKVTEYEYRNLHVFVIIPKAGDFGLIVDDDKEKFMQKVKEAIKIAEKKGNNVAIDDKVCIPKKSYYSRQIEINCINEEDYISAEIINILSQFYD